MSRNSVITIVVLVIVIAAVVGLVVFFRGEDGGFSFRTSKVTTTPSQRDTAGTTPMPRLEEPIVLIHRYENGTHFFAGNMKTPTPCHTITQEVAVNESQPEQFQINFTIHEPSADVVCTQVVTRKDFSFDVKGGPDAKVIGVDIDNQSVPFEIFAESKG